MRIYDKETVRMNVRMSKEIHDYYAQLALDMGVSKSFVMVMALKQYIDTQTALTASKDMPALLKQLQANMSQIKKG